MAWFQKEIVLAARSRGFHLVTKQLLTQVPEIGRIEIGLVHFFLQHTSASLALNENADPTVRSDMEAHFNELAPEDAPYYIHTYEGPDDMPAHIKAVLLGSSLTLPIRDGRLSLGTWQGIYLCEHRDRAAGRRLVVTLHGELREGASF
jgi:secondary thiamine-phosphate synthase enzyme